MWIRTKRKMKHTKNPTTIKEIHDNAELEKLYNAKMKKKAARRKWLSDNIVAIVLGVISLAVTILFHII